MVALKVKLMDFLNIKSKPMDVYKRDALQESLICSYVLGEK